MVIFGIETLNDLSKISRDRSSIIVVDISMQSWDEVNMLQLDNNFMPERYGFALSKYDRNCFLTHYNAWVEFGECDEEYCLVLEDTASINSLNEETIHIIQSILEENHEWDIFFPFDRTQNINYKIFLIGYVLGYPWGSDAYFISRRGIEKLLKIKKIRQPVDEEILWLMLNDELDVYYKDIGLFSFNNNLHKEKSRRSIIRNAIFDSDVWTIGDKEKIKKLINEVSSLAQMANVDLVLSDGSLLGHIRHGGIMPWDDDVDFAVEKDSVDYFQLYIEEHSNLKTKRSYWGGISDATYIKIWSDDGKSITGHSHKFPFIDVWPYYQRDNEIIFPHGKKYPIDIFYPFSDATFEGSSFKLPSHPLKYLDILYPDWRTNIQIYMWNHQKEQDVNIPLNLKITIDECGKILPDEPIDLNS